MLLLAVPTIVYINLALPYCTLSMVAWSSGSLYSTPTRNPCLDTPACVVIERVYTCPTKSPYESLVCYPYRGPQEFQDQVGPNFYCVLTVFGKSIIQNSFKSAVPLKVMRLLSTLS